MKNSNLKKLFALFGVAVLAGVLSLGIHVVSGANPSVNPPGSGVSPTFTGVTVNGAGTLTGDLDVKGNIKNTNAGHAVYFTDPEGVSITGGLSVTGAVKNASSVANAFKIDDNLEVTGGISNPTTDTALLLNDSVYVDGQLDVKTEIINTVGNAVKIADTLDVTNTISNTGSTNMSTVKINDNLDVVNNVQSQANVVVGYANGGKLMIKAPGYANTINVATGEITGVNGLILDSVDGSIKNTGNGAVKIDDSLTVSGVSNVIDLHGGILNSSTTSNGLAMNIPNPVWVNDVLLVSQKIKALSIENDLGSEPFEISDPSGAFVHGYFEVQGDIDNAGENERILISDSENDTTANGGNVLALGIGNDSPSYITNKSKKIVLQDGGGQGVDIGKAGANSSLGIYGDLDVRGNIRNDGSVFIFGSGVIPFSVYVDDGLIVNGNATAKKFGNHVERLSNFITLGSGSAGSTSAACDAGDYILSCSAEGSEFSNSYSATQWVAFSRIYANVNDNKCYIYGKNNHSSANRYIRAVAVCMDPGA